MRKYNAKLNKDITDLKTLHAKKDKTEFNKMKSEVMKRHKISKATVYREMKKDMPGSYKRPRYSPPVREITDKEKELVSGMLFKQFPVERIRAEMEKQTGESYSWDRIDKIRDETEKDKAASKTKGIIELKNSRSPGFGYESPHGEDMKVFIGKVLNIDKIDPRSYVTISFKGYDFRMSSDFIKEKQTEFANSAACGGRDEVTWTKQALKHLAMEEARYMIQGKPHTMKDITEVRKVLEDYSTEAKTSAGFELVVKLVQQFAPGAERIDIVFAANRLSEEFGGRDNEYMPDIEESMEADAKWAKANM